MFERRFLPAALVVSVTFACDVGTVAPTPDAGPGKGGSSSSAGSAGTVTNGAGAGTGGGTAGAGAQGGGTGGERVIGEGGVPDLGDDEPIGWASVSDLGLEGTTGGGDAEIWDVVERGIFETAVSGSEPRVIHYWGEYVGRLSIGSNKTIIGLGGAVIRGSVRLSGSQNVILRNLTIVGENCAGDPQCRSGEDAINVSGGAHHLWFDHLDVSDGSDGNLDITQGSDYVTVSWTKFWYSSRDREHRFANLIGASDNSPIDVGKLRVTFHHNWWTENVDQRMPRSRYGQIHVFNNLYTPTGNLYCVNAGMEATLLVERNVFRGPRSPQDVSSNGNLLAIDNVYENTTGNLDETGVGFDPPYDYALDPTDGLPEAIMAGVGPR